MIRHIPPLERIQNRWCRSSGIFAHRYDDIQWLHHEQFLQCIQFCQHTSRWPWQSLQYSILVEPVQFDNQYGGLSVEQHELEEEGCDHEPDELLDGQDDLVDGEMGQWEHYEADDQLDGEVGVEYDDRQDDQVGW